MMGVFTPLAAPSDQGTPNSMLWLPAFPGSQTVTQTTWPSLPHVCRCFSPSVLSAAVHQPGLCSSDSPLSSLSALPGPLLPQILACQPPLKHYLPIPRGLLWPHPPWSLSLCLILFTSQDLLPPEILICWLSYCLSRARTEASWAWRSSPSHFFKAQPSAWHTPGSQHLPSGLSELVSECMHSTEPQIPPRTHAPSLVGIAPSFLFWKSIISGTSPFPVTKTLKRISLSIYFLLGKGDKQRKGHQMQTFLI